MFKLVLFASLIVASLSAPQSPYYNRAVPGAERQAKVLRLQNEVYPDGSYIYGYDTENGISAQQQGQLKTIGNNQGNAAQGDFQYTSPEGIQVQQSYIADENGFQPTGNLLPTPPPIPAAILRALEYIARSQPAQTYNPYRQNY